MTRTLLSQPNLEKLARMTDMHLKAQNQAELEQVTDRMRNNISIGSEVTTQSVHHFLPRYRSQESAGGGTGTVDDLHGDDARQVARGQ